MVKRKYWLKRIEAAWRKHNVVWLAGVRRAGKTMLCRSLAHVEYFDCERPRVRQQMADPEAFLEGLRGKNPIAIECKWRAERFNPDALQSFRRSYPKGRNFIVAHDVERPFKRRFFKLETTFCPLDSLIELLARE